MPLLGSSPGRAYDRRWVVSGRFEALTQRLPHLSENIAGWLFWAN
jgi:hypothetical protein